MMNSLYEILEDPAPINKQKKDQVGFVKRQSDSD